MSADNCENACTLCDLHKYMGQTSGYTASAMQAFRGPIENDQWLGFRAATDSVQFNGTVIAPNSSTVTITAPGTYVLIATQTQGGLTCIASDTIIIAGSTTPPVINDVQVINDQRNQGLGAIYLTVTGTPTYTVNWFFNGQMFATTPTISHLMAGTYVVSMTTPNGCSAADTIR